MIEIMSLREFCPLVGADAGLGFGEGRSTSFLLLFFGVLCPLVHKLSVFSFGFLGVGISSTLVGLVSSFALKGDWGDKTLNSWCNAFRFFAFFFDDSSDNVLSNRVTFVQSEELSDVVSSFGSKSSWDLFVSESLDFAITLFDNDQVKNGQIVVNDATTDGFSLTFTGSARSVAFLSFLQKKLHTTDSTNTLFHGESLFVVSSSDTENVAGPFSTEVVGCDFLSHSLVIEMLELLLIVNFKDFLTTRLGISDVEFH